MAGRRARTGVDILYAREITQEDAEPLEKALEDES